MLTLGLVSFLLCSVCIYFFLKRQGEKELEVLRSITEEDIMEAIKSSRH